jgi:amino acid adenylation domain-containing protein
MSDAKRRLLEKLLRGEAARQNREAPLEPRAAGVPIPLAPVQQLFWLSSQMAGSEPAYNEPVTIHYRGALDRDVLERSFNEVIRRHEILRTTFAQIDQEIVQAVHDHLTIPFPLLDLSALEKSQRELEAERIATADARRPFDLGVGPLIRVRLVKMEAEYYRLYVTLHHVICDAGAVYQALLPELAAIYDSLATGSAPLPEPRLQYADFALWQKRMLESESIERQTNYWRERLAGELPELQLPADRPRPAVHSYRGAMKTFTLPAELTGALRNASRAEGVTPYMFLMAAFKTLLHRYSGQQDILVGGVSDMRRRPEFQRMMGLFLNTLALRTYPSDEMTFRDYAAQVKDTLLGALANGDVPFDRLLRDLQLKRECAGRPFFQATFSMKQAGGGFTDPRWDLTQMDIATGFTKIDLYLEIDERPDSMNAKFVYSTGLFEAGTIERMIGHLLTLLESAIANPSAKLCDLTILTAEEERLLRVDWNHTGRAIPETSVHQLIEQQAARTPNAIAVEAYSSSGRRECLTYRELNQRSNRLAHELRRSGVMAGTLVALCVERTLDLAVAPLAVWKAGGAYLPLDSGFPKERLKLLLEDAQAPVLLTTRALHERLTDTPKVIYCETPADTQADAPADNLAPGHPDSLAYVRYTSGSTGRPKGVEIHHRALVNLLLSMQREPGFKASDALLAVTTFSFDIAELELFLPLISGGRVVIASRDDARDPRRLLDRLRESKCNVLQATPAAWRGLIDAGWTGQQNLRAFCGGEALARDLADQLLPRVAELWNLYGPTETTVWSAVDRVQPGSRAVAIGHPIDNTEIFILDAHGKLLPVGAVGELCIGGAGLARGYLRREDLTHERFVPHPFQTNERVYRTGDLARRLADGTLECLGRVDNQIKIRGFRIELGEIEAVLLGHEDVRAAAVRTWPDASGNLSIAAYITGPALPGELRRFLAQKLPDYMIPAYFVALESLPLTPNGKLDRNALPEPAAVEKVVPMAGGSPRNEAERKLTEIFEAILAVRPIGIGENFFELGGHSFLVAKLLRRIEIEFGQRLSMGAVFEAPTIARLAELLSDASSVARMPGTISLQPAGAREPLFWVQGGPLFRPLANSLDINRPFLGVDFDDSDREVIPGSLAEFAAILVRKVRASQPHGPYYVGGWCVSGLLAYEVARQLMESGQEVGLVVMLDAVNPQHFCAIPKRRMMASKTAFHIRQMLRIRIGDAIPYAIARAKGMLQEAFNRPTRPEHPFDVAMLPAAINYRPEPIGARVLAVQPVDRPHARDLEQSWSEYLKHGNIEIRDVPGDHLTMFEQPHVKALAKCIKNKLRDNVVEIRRAIAG